MGGGPKSHADPCTRKPPPGVPPFQGGAAGVLGYDLGRWFEEVPAAAADEFGVPVVALGLYDVVIAWDHHEGRAWIVSQGLPETDTRNRRIRAEARLRQIAGCLSGEIPPPKVSRPEISRPTTRIPAATNLPPQDLASQFPIGGVDGFTSNFSRCGYLAAVGRAIDYIEAG